MTLWVQLTDQTFTDISNRNFAQKSVKQKVWPFESNGQIKPAQLSLIEILLKKVRGRKCDPLGPVDNLHNYISINRNFAQKSAT